MKQLSMFIALIFSCFAVYAQGLGNVNPASANNQITSIELQKNTIYAEVGGNGTLYSLNFDQIFLAADNFRLSGRIGLGVTSNVFSGDIDPIIPVEWNLWWGGKNNHYFETGIGVVAALGAQETSASLSNTTESGVTIRRPVGNKEYNSMYAFTRLGYRYQSTNGGLFFRAGLTPTITAYAKNASPSPRLEGSISVGITIKQKPARIPVLNWN